MPSSRFLRSSHGWHAVSPAKAFRYDGLGLLPRSDPEKATSRGMPEFIAVDPAERHSPPSRAQEAAPCSPGKVASTESPSTACHAVGARGTVRRSSQNGCCGNAAPAGDSTANLDLLYTTIVWSCALPASIGLPSFP